MEHITYTIPTSASKDALKALQRMQAKAARYGKLLAITEGDVYAAKRNVIEREFDPQNGCQIDRIVGTELVEVFDLTIESDIIVLDGYTVIAQIDHMDGGNVVRMLVQGKPKASWYDLPQRCDHCGQKRTRTTTFIVRSADGCEKQIGRSCLKDYCGIDPQLIGSLNALRDLILSEYDYRMCDMGTFHASRVFDSMDVLALSYRVLAAQGYRKSSDPSSNRYAITELLISGAEPTAEELEHAKRCAEKLAAMPLQVAIDHILADAQRIMASAYCKIGFIGYIAYAPVALARFEEAEARKATERSSEWVGEVGARITFDVTGCTLLSSWEGQYGMTYLYKFTTDSGSTLIWYASKSFVNDGVKRIKATVKAHTDRDGMKQTIITRCEAA